MPWLADAIEQCQPRCLQQHPSVPSSGARLAANTGTCLFGGAGSGIFRAGRWQGWHGVLLFGSRGTG